MPEAHPLLSVGQPAPPPAAGPVAPQVPQVGAPSGAAPQAPAGAAPTTGVTLQDALNVLGQVPLQGRAFLVGEIVATGQTNDAVEIAVTDDADRQPLQDAATFPTVFHTVAGEPREQFAEIGSGSQGGEQMTPEMMGIAA